MKDLYLIDGYNVIFCLPEIFDSNNLDAERKRLIDLMEDFGAHNDLEVIVVFDGKGKYLKSDVQNISQEFQVVYTPAKMTADSYIEKESYYRRKEYRSIYVVTSDGAEQNQILGNGAYRMAVSELFRMWKEDKEVQSKFIKQHNLANKRNEIGKNVPEYVRDKLNQLRKRGKR